MCADLTPTEVEAIFAAAVEKNSPAEQASHLDEACGNDADLRARVEALLKAHKAASGLYFDSPLFANGATVPDLSLTEGEGTVIGRYRLLQEIGEGGFGAVYMAEQEQPVRRKVALKIIKLGMDTKQVIARFEAERQALAMMDHSNIAKVLDAGATDTGRPFFVMELVRGIPITEYCDKNNLTTAERLDLFVDVCRAVQHAHQKGIIHRDIKPTNVMVTLHNGRPMPKVIDFGIAKATQHRLTEKTLYTDYHQFMGTPQYMSPEQAAMSDGDVDTRTDIYSLGVLLYELLVGSTPFQLEELREIGYDEICRIIRENDPLTPSKRLSTLGEAATTELAEHRQAQPAALRRLLRGDLDWIVMKALEKDRTRRYETANDFADDVQRYVANEPVEACHPSAVYKFRKFARRNSALLTTVIFVVAALLIGTVVSVWLAADATIARRETEKARRRAEDLRYVSDMNRAMQALNDRDSRLVRRLSRQHHPSSPTSDGADRRGWEWYYLWRACRGTVPTLHHDHIVNTITISPDGRTLVSGDATGNLNVWDVPTRKRLDSTKAHRSRVIDVDFSPDGTFLVSSGYDNYIRLWKMDPGTRTLINDVFLQGDVAVGNWQKVVFSNDGMLLASAGHEGVIRLWDLSTQERVAQIPGHVVFALAFHPDGQALAAHCGDNVAIWQSPFDSDTPTWMIPGFKNIGFVGLAFSPDGRSIAASSKKNGVELWNVVDRQRLHRLETATTANSIAFSPDGKTIAVGSQNKIVSLWDTATGEKLDELSGHSSAICCVRFTCDGKTLASSSMDKTVRLWHLSQDDAEDEQPDALYHHLTTVDEVSFSGDGMWLATAAGRWVDTGSSKVVLCDTKTWRPREFSGKNFAFSHDSRLLAISGGNAETVQLWDLHARQFLPAIPQRVTGQGKPLAFSPDGNLAVSDGETLQLWSPYERKVVAKYRASKPSLEFTPRTLMYIGFAPNGQTLATTDVRGDVALLDAKTLRLLRHVPEALEMWGHKAAFSGDGDYWVTPDYDHSIKVWDVRDGKLEPFDTFRDHSDSAICAAFSPDNLLAVGCANGKVKLWDSATWTERATLTCHDRSVSAICFSPDGRTLVTGSEDTTVRIHRAASPEEVIEAERRGDDPLSLD